MLKSYLWIAVALLLTGATYAQQQRIKGRVLDETR
ncbi:hypothetical protein SAMN05444369_101236 [Capnocytophaga haemolytica]|uniref:Uncharacterized protein n=1 Tax=Capnocytophaga haemolytica TaxID=45243 RepID=A0AAX2GY63_9FLAO|nr:hypothetical protein SAMN05444369_101236 [Capnocytophaga haemolytica]SNV04561.1 Uncharacterised protein [Capnocytophaga haemolytica]